MAPRQETGFQVRLREAIVEAGLNKARLEKLVGTSGGYVSKLLTGVLAEGRVSLEIAEAMAEFLGVNMLWLFRDKGPKRSGDLLNVPQDVSPREASKAAAQFFKMPAHIVDAVQKQYASKAYDARDAMWWMARYEGAIKREHARHEHMQSAKRSAEARAAEHAPPASEKPKKRRATA